MVKFKDAPSENGTGDSGGGAIALQEFLTAMAIAQDLILLAKQWQKPAFINYLIWFWSALSVHE